MRVIVLTTGTEILLGDVRDRHLSFIAQEIMALGLRVVEQRTVPDGDAIGEALVEVCPRADLLFVTGGLGPTTDDITRDLVAGFLGLELVHDETVMAKITERLHRRRIPITKTISRQAQVPRGAVVLPNENGTAPGFYLRNNLNPARPSPHIFVLPGPPRELQPMFQSSVNPLLREIAPKTATTRRIYRIVGMGESLVERAIGEKILALPGVELGYCARPGEVDLRVMGPPDVIAKADEIIFGDLGASIFSTEGESLEQVLVKQLRQRRETLALAESCTGGYLANRITNVPGASEVLLAGYVTYANAAKTDLLQVDPSLIAEHGAVSEPIAAAMAEGARARARSTYAIATTGIAGPDGGSAEKPVGTVYVGLARASGVTVKKLFYPSERETFKDLTAQAAFDLLRRELTRGARGPG